MNTYTLPVLGVTVVLAVLTILYVRLGKNPGTKVVLSVLTSLSISGSVISLFA
jgi:hypothetical protein